MDALINRLREAVEKAPEVSFAILFGSGATGQLRPTSDVDVAVRFASGRKPEGWNWGALIAALESVAGRRVDLVDLETSTSTVLQFEIAKGVLLKGQPNELVAFKVRAFRGWREFGPRFRRCARALASHIAQQAEANH